MEATDHITSGDDHVNVSGKMHLLISANAENKDHLYQTLEDVYHNFTSIRNATLALLGDLDTKFSGKGRHAELGLKVRLLITFCRCKLMHIFEEDGITINGSEADLLTKVEFHLVDLVKNCTNQNVHVLCQFYWLKNLKERITMSFLRPSPIYCYQLINCNLMMEYLDMCIDDIDHFYWPEDMTSLKENYIVLRNYLKLLISVQNVVENLDKSLISVENVAYKMECFLFVVVICNNDTRMDHYGSHHKIGKTLSVFHAGVLEVLVFQSDYFSRSNLIMGDELLIRYVKCVQRGILDLLKYYTIDLTVTLTDTSKCQLKILHEGLSFLMHLLITYPSKHYSQQNKFSDIRLDFLALARNAGSVICSYFDNPKIEEMSFELFDLTEKMDLIKGEIIKTICCMVLQKKEQESQKQDHLGSLILILQNLKEFMNHRPGFVTWKDHENLVLFIFYLIQNDNTISRDEFSQNNLQLDVTLINDEELNGFLVSAQVAAFKMASSSLLRRHGRFHWWDLYMGTKEHADMHMRLGILKAIVLSSATPFSNELLISYGEYVQDSLLQLLSDEFVDELKDQFNIIYEWLSFLVHLLISYKDEQEKLSQISVCFQDWVRSVGSVICSRLINRVHGDTGTKQSSTELSNAIEEMNLIMVDTEELFHLEHINKIRRESPKTDQLGSLNSLLENWKGLMECESDLIITWKDQFQMIHKNLVLFKSFITSSSLGDDESRDICSSIADAGHVAEYLLTTFSIGTCPVRSRDHWILEFTRHVDVIKAALMKLNEKRGSIKEINVAGNGRSQVSARALLVPTSNNVVVGFEVEMELIRKRLTSHLKQLDVISIVGMPGLGKTTLARKVYEDPYTINHFDVRAWCCISQEYNKKDSFLAILGSIIELTDEIKGQSEADLSLKVHQQLKGRRYFVVLDDIWDINAFTHIKCFFPDDNQGSKIMLTSRSKIIGSLAQTQCNSDLIEPACLTNDQSWDLLELKVYNKGKCPSELCTIGKEIAKQCRGLPLAVVLVGGVLAKGAFQKIEFWKQVTRNFSSYLARASQSQFMAAIELSYDFLPNCLKPLFLYFGAFSEDQEIPTVKLMRLWIAEGFVQKTEPTSLEIQAETNLIDLIDRSLVMVAKRRWDGKVKACHVHDLLRDMCLAKAKEEYFMKQVHVHRELPDPIMYEQRLVICLARDDETTSRHLVTYKYLPKFSITPPTYSLLFFNVGPKYFLSEQCLEPVVSSLKLLRVFDIEIFQTTQDVLEKYLVKLVHLRYMSFRAKLQTFPSSISQLRCLETLIFNGERGEEVITVPESIWEMTKLRHLHISPAFEFSTIPENTLTLKNLETLSAPSIVLGEEEKIFKKLPGLKKLTCYFFTEGEATLPNLESFGRLESFKSSSYSQTKLKGQLKLPLKLKKLRILYFNLEWSQISIFHTLPNLEVLELGDASVRDEHWDMEDDDVFTNLKVLKLDELEIKRWSASSVNFPRLEKLVLKRCSDLEEMPSNLEEFYSLQKIEVTGHYSSSSVKMAKEIKKEQEEIENDSLKFYIHES